jgi:hypothetical protein
MKAIISADELAKDVAGAEALLERHQEHKVYPTIYQSLPHSLMFFGPLSLQQRNWLEVNVDETVYVGMTWNEN